MPTQGKLEKEATRGGSHIVDSTMVVDKCKSVQLVVHYHHDVLLVLYLLLLILLFSPEVSHRNICSQYTGNAC